MPDLMHEAPPVTRTIIKSDAPDIHDLVLIETPDGEGYRRIRIEWRDQLGLERGYTMYASEARIMHDALSRIRARDGINGVSDYLIGRIHEQNRH